MSEEEGLDEDGPPPLILAPLEGEQDYPVMFMEPNPKPSEHPAGLFWTREAFFLFILRGRKDTPSTPDD
jgi:hypothetical protein